MKIFKKAFFSPSKIIAIIALLIVGIVSLNIISRNTKLEKISGATWEVVIRYDSVSDNLSLKGIRLAKKIITPTESLEKSPFSLQVMSRDGKVVYKKKIDIAMRLDYNLLAYPIDGSTQSADFTIPAQPKTLETLLYVPYFNDASEIVIYNGKKKVLRINPPSGNFQVDSVRISESCNPLTTVFISDGYTNLDTYHADVKMLTQTLMNTEPFKSKTPSVFDFKTIDNNEPLGCVHSLISCSKNTALVKQIVSQSVPSAKKIIVLVNRPINTPADGAVAGINTPSVSFFSNASDGVGRSLIPAIAVHEFLGHGVSGLDERYVMNGNTASGTGPNCSSNPAGKSFWAQAGVTQTYPGCAYENNYAPSPLNCPASSNQGLFSAGTTTSVMSSAGCGSVQFDVVEQYWIKNYILPKYSACTGDVTPTTSPSSSPSPTASIQVCDPYDEGSSKGRINIQDVLLIRNEVAKLTNTNKGSCLVEPRTGATTIADLLKSRRMSAGLE